MHPSRSRPTTDGPPFLEVQVGSGWTNPTSWQYEILGEAGRVPTPPQSSAQLQNSEIKTSYRAPLLFGRLHENEWGTVVVSFQGGVGAELLVFAPREPIIVGAGRMCKPDSHVCY
jgi:hypothetical protein